jgi:transposase, IS6 family
MPITASDPFKWRQYPGEVILLCVRWYLRFPLSYAHVAELMQERGLAVDRSCVWRWVQDYAPELNKRCRPYLKPAGKSWRVDETYIRVKGQDRYLYRAVDSTGQTIEFLLTAQRDAAAAKRFLRKALRASATPPPRVINVDRNPAYPAAVEQLQAKGTLRRRCRLRRCKFLNNVVEQDHRVPKQRVWLAKGYHSFHSAWRTLQGIEAVHMIRKGRARRVAKGNAAAQAQFIDKLFGLAS